jgi:glycosyltransferase involved in cell wall biosynthesis
VRVVLDARTATSRFPGIGRYVSQLARALAAAGSRHNLTLLGNVANPDDQFALPGLSRVGCTSSPFSLAQHLEIPGRLRKAGAALYHSPYYLMPLVLPVPAVLTCHDLIPLLFPQYFTSVQRVIFNAAHRLALRQVAHTIAVSESTKSDLVNRMGADAEKVSVIHLAADSHFTPRTAEEIEQVREKYRVPGRYILYVGTNKPHKNLPRLVESWSIACRDLPKGEWTLAIAGYWDRRYPEAMILAESKGMARSIRFLGDIAEKDLPAIYSGTDLFIFPSLYEGFGLPVLEAMACGAAVVCSNTSSLPEVAGGAASYFDPQSSAEIASVILKILTDESARSAGRRAALKRASEFSWQQTASETIRVYETVGGS